MVALWGGFECTVNRVGDRFWNQADKSPLAGGGFDFEQLGGLGLGALRLPILWETTTASSEHLDVVDKQMSALERLQIAPIVGLVHHGSGPAVTNLLDDGFAPGLATHAALVARRYPHVHDWTPVNEPLTTARFSCLYGHWYPHRQDEAALWLALINQIDATRLAMRAIRQVNPTARLIQTDDLGQAYATPELALQCDFENQRRWLTWDLLAGRVESHHPLWSRIAAFGLGDRLRAIVDDPCPADVIGINHYLCSNRFLTHRHDLHPDHKLASDGIPCVNLDAARTVPVAADLASLLRQAWSRFGTNVAITECHNGSTREEQMRWFYQGWQAALLVEAEGVPVEAVTAWSLLGSFDWNSLLTRHDGHYEPGVFDIRSDPARRTAMVGLLRALGAGDEPPLPTITKALGWWQRAGRMLDSYEISPARAVAEGPPILITGATGTLARAVAGQCRARDLVHVLTDRSLLELTDRASVAAALDNLEPWAVINCAGLVDIDGAEGQSRLCHQVNSIGPETLARECAAREIRLVHISSDQVFDGMLGTPYCERNATRALNAYGRAKAEGERRVRWECTDALIVRTAALFSPHDRYNFAVATIDSLASGRPFNAADEQSVSPTYVPDLVTMLLDLLLDGESGLWHLANSGGMSWADFAGALAEAKGLPRGLVRRSTGRMLGQIAPRPSDVRLTSSRGLVMPDLASAIARFSEEYEPA